jgi:hypothetical protein
MFVFSWRDSNSSVKSLPISTENVMSDQERVAKLEARVAILEAIVRPLFVENIHQKWPDHPIRAGRMMRELCTKAVADQGIALTPEVRAAIDATFDYIDVSMRRLEPIGSPDL